MGSHSIPSPFVFSIFLSLHCNVLLFTFFCFYLRILDIHGAKTLKSRPPDMFCFVTLHTPSKQHPKHVGGGGDLIFSVLAPCTCSILK